MLGPLARAQTPADPQEPVPPPPEPHAAPPLEAPRTGVEALPTARPAAETQDPDRSETRTGEPKDVAATTAPGERVYVPKEPPPPIAERPSGTRPDRKAVWTSGYWEWDPDGDRFVWVAGSWRVPPARMVWVPGRWMPDAGGWYWVAGAWGRSAKRPGHGFEPSRLADERSPGGAPR